MRFSTSAPAVAIPAVFGLVLTLLSVLAPAAQALPIDGAAHMKRLVKVEKISSNNPNGKVVIRIKRLASQDPDNKYANSIVLSLRSTPTRGGDGHPYDTKVLGKKKGTYTITLQGPKKTVMPVIVQVQEQGHYAVGLLRWQRILGPDRASVSTRVVSAKEVVVGELLVAVPGLILTFVPQKKILTAVSAFAGGWSFYKAVKARLGFGKGCPALTKGQFVRTSSWSAAHQGQVKVMGKIEVWKSKKAYKNGKKPQCRETKQIALL